MAASEWRCAIVALLIAFLACGCTSRELYRYGQEHQREQCRSGPPSEYDQCMQRANESYETYQRNRGEVEEAIVNPDPTTGDTN